MQAEFPANMSGRLTIAAAGRTYERTVIVPRGEPSNFLTEGELRQKFLSLAAPVLGAERAGHLGDAVLAMAGAPSVSPLLRMAAPMTGVQLAGD